MRNYLLNNKVAANLSFMIFFCLQDANLCHILAFVIFSQFLVRFYRWTVAPEDYFERINPNVPGLCVRTMFAVVVCSEFTYAYLLISQLLYYLQNAILLWTYDPPERDARLINEALKARKKGVKHLQVIVEVACASSPHHLMAVRQAYCSLFDCSLEEDIASCVQLPLRKVIFGV